MTDKDDEIERLKRERGLLIEAERQGHRRLEHPEVTWTERQAIHKDISATIEKRRVLARRLHELGLTYDELGVADAKRS